METIHQDSRWNDYFSISCQVEQPNSQQADLSDHFEGYDSPIDFNFRYYGSHHQSGCETGAVICFCLKCERTSSWFGSVVATIGWERETQTVVVSGGLKPGERGARRWKGRG